MQFEFLCDSANKKVCFSHLRVPRTERLAEGKTDETQSGVSDKSFQSKLMRTVQLHAIFLVWFGNDCNDLTEVSCNLQMTQLGLLRRNIARMNVFESSVE